MRRLFPPRGLVAAFFPSRLSQWLGPLAAAGVLAGLLAIIVIAAGLPDLSASKPHPAGWASLLHTVFRRSIRHHSRDLAVPADFGSGAMIAKGAGYYGMACAHCHGGPGLGQNPIAMSMRPRPQYLVRAVAQFDDRALFRIVKHGVKYSAMPAFPVQTRDDEIWAVVSFLRAMPVMDVARFRALAYGDAAVAGSPPVAGLANRFATHRYAAKGDDELTPDNYRHSWPAIGFDDFAMRGDPTGYCSRCHVDGGIGRAGGAVPNLTLLGRGYLRTELLRFASGSRTSGFMLPVATQLSPAQIDALAAYYGDTRRGAPDPVTAPPATLALGARIAGEGLNAHRTDACSNCHDVTRPANRAYPAIDGQHAAYLAGRLRQFRAEPLPAAGGGNPMQAIARRLDDQAIDAVAAFYASRPPGATAPVSATVH